MAVSTGIRRRTNGSARREEFSFDRVASAIEQGGLMDVLTHPNQDRYPKQLIYVVDTQQYVHLVPFVTDADGTRFLKTVIPSRTETRNDQRRRPL